MERAPNIKLSKEEQKAHEAAERRRRIFDTAAGEKAVEQLNAFLAEQGITEEEWKRAAGMRERRKEKG